jgi:hypothetical protein
MKKGLLLLLAGVMAFSVAVQSMASARLDSMASNVWQVEDYDSIWLYPNKVLDYKNTVDFRLNNNFGGLGNAADNWGGVIAEENELLGGVIGAYINRPDRLYTAAQAAGGSGFRSLFRYYWTPVGNRNHPDNNSTNILDLFWGSSMDNGALGIHLNYGNDGVGQGVNENENYGIGVGLGLNDLAGFTQANFHLHLAHQSNFDTGENLTFLGTYSIKLGTLLEAEVDKDNSLRIFGDITYNQSNADGNDYGDYGVLLGMACNHKVNGGKGLVSTGLIVDYLNVVTTANYGANSVDSHSWNLIWNASVEAEVSNWLALRTGIVSVLVSRNYTEAPSYTDNENAPVWTAGFGIKWQNFVLDGNINVATLENLLAGPNAGAGIFYPGGNGGAGNNGIVTVINADMKYKF